MEIEINRETREGRKAHSAVRGAKSVVQNEKKTAAAKRHKRRKKRTQKEVKSQ